MHSKNQAKFRFTYLLLKAILPIKDNTMARIKLLGNLLLSRLLNSVEESLSKEYQIYFPGHIYKVY